MGGSAKAPQQSDDAKKNERLSNELMKEQLKAAKQPAKVPDIKVPPPAPPAPPPPTQSSSDVQEAAEAERRKAGRRVNTAKGTLFAGETGGYGANALGGQKTLLG